MFFRLPAKSYKKGSEMFTLEQIICHSHQMISWPCKIWRYMHRRIQRSIKTQMYVPFIVMTLSIEKYSNHSFQIARQIQIVFDQFANQLNAPTQLNVPRKFSEFNLKVELLAAIEEKFGKYTKPLQVWNLKSKFEIKIEIHTIFTEYFY